MLACGAYAQAPAKAPPGSTAQCNDGSYSNAARRSEACRQHRGVKTWLGTASEAVQTQSPAVTDTQVAPAPTGPSRAPGTPENPHRPAQPAPRTLSEPNR
jgi:hypothetical protein